MAKKWTPEERAAQAEKMKKSHAAKRAQVLEPTVINPPANDDLVQVPDPAPQRAARVSRVARPASDHDAVAVLIDDLSSLSLDGVSYDDCGTLLNALSAASTAIALRRRQAQEQLEAGTHRAPCSTCGRSIDISKAGGFQILTERDEHWQPHNVYYCSQNCLLAKNMPSHRAKKVPGDVGAKV